MRTVQKNVNVAQATKMRKEITAFTIRFYGISVEMKTERGRK